MATQLRRWRARRQRASIPDSRVTSTARAAWICLVQLGLCRTQSKIPAGRRPAPRAAAAPAVAPRNSIAREQKSPSRWHEQQPAFEPQCALVVQHLLPPVADHVLRMNTVTTVRGASLLTASRNRVWTGDFTVWRRDDLERDADIALLPRVHEGRVSTSSTLTVRPRAGRTGRRA